MSIPMCSGSHCSKISDKINTTCKKEGWPVGHLVLVCDSSGSCCNCTCSCFAWGTKILIPDNKVKVIQDFAIGDEVMACGSDLKWETKIVKFSHGTKSDSIQPMMLQVVYGENKNELIVTMDHLFLVSGNRLKRADKLIVDEDFLISPEGNKVEIHSIAVGGYKGAVHHIATSTDKPTSLDGHLIASEGVISADYAIQVYYQHGELDPDKFLVSNHENILQIAEDQVNSKFLATDKLKSKPITKSKGFISKSDLLVDIPEYARRFFTEAQSKELGEKAPLHPKGYSINQQAVEYLFQLFRAFYPQISFLTDFYNDDFNAFSWEKRSRMFVVVSGGITRVKTLELEGLALIIAHEVGHLLAEPNSEGKVCEGNADYYAIQCVLRKVFYQEFFQMIFSGALPQIKNTFAYIIKNRGINKSCNNLSLDCRYKVYEAAGALNNMPSCAGGPELLTLDKAENTNNGLILTFNEKLNAGTAQTVSNYQIIPSNNDKDRLEITKATYSFKHPYEVNLKVNGLEKGKEYMVVVSNLISEEGENLDPQKNSAVFKG